MVSSYSRFNTASATTTAQKNNVQYSMGPPHRIMKRRSRDATPLARCHLGVCTLSLRRLSVSIIINLALSASNARFFLPRRRFTVGSCVEKRLCKINYIQTRRYWPTGVLKTPVIPSRWRASHVSYLARRTHMCQSISSLSFFNAQAGCEATMVSLLDYYYI